MRVGVARETGVAVILVDLGTLGGASSEAEPDQSFSVGVYRSSSSTFDPSTAILVNTVTEDANGNDFDESLGQHTDVIDDPAALLPDPLHEYVYVVADPAHDIGDPNGVYHEAHYRKFVLGVISHGLSFFGQVTGIPGWESQMAQDLVSIDGYDDVIPFDWSNTSNLPVPGMAVAAGNQLEQQIISTADSLVENYGNPGDVVDLQLIGHTRGAVVISQALQDLVGTSDPVLAGGYKDMTLLDPHPANNSFASPDYSAGKDSFSQYVVVPGYLAFQALAQDPQMVIPSNVDQAEEYFQHTPASALSIFSRSPWEPFINFWGENPLLIDNQSSEPLISLDFTDDNAPGIGVIGHSEVPLWYDQYIVQQRNIFPGYSGSDVGSSDVIANAAQASSPGASPSGESRISSVPQSGANLNSSAIIQTGNSQTNVPAAVRAVPQTTQPTVNAPSQPSVLNLIIPLGDNPTGQAVVPRPSVRASASQVRIGSRTSPCTVRLHRGPIVTTRIAIAQRAMKILSYNDSYSKPD